MVKSGFVNRLSGHFSQKAVRASEVELAVNIIIDQLKKAVLTKQRIEIRGFGSFRLSHQSARNCRNPKTNQTVKLPERFCLRFKAGKGLLDGVNGR